MISSWSEFYRELWAHAAQSRGTVTSTEDGSDTASYQTLAEWPRTTIGDVIAIVMVVDAALAEVPVRPGGYGLNRLWQSAVIELEASSTIPYGDGREYPHNRSFWSTLLAVAAYLQTMHAPLPLEEMIDEVREQLTASPMQRNAQSATAVEHHPGGGADAVTIRTNDFPGMLDAQLSELARIRGFDFRIAPGGAAAGINVPRTTNDDALRLSNYWGKALVDLQVKVMTGAIPSPKDFGPVQEHWQAVSGDVELHAKAGRAQDTYPHNEDLWRAARALAAMLAALDTAPKPYDVVPRSEMSRVGEAAEQVVHAIGNIAQEARAGLKSAVTKPVIITGGVLLGLYLLLRQRSSKPQNG
jgi:hypothetical protein